MACSNITPTPTAAPLASESGRESRSIPTSASSSKPLPASDANGPGLAALEFPAPSSELASIIAFVQDCSTSFPTLSSLANSDSISKP